MSSKDKKAIKQASFPLGDYGSLNGKQDDQQQILTDIDQESLQSESHGGPPRHIENYFKDGKRQIDFVIVYEVANDRKPTSNDEIAQEERYTKWRKKYLERLKTAGLELEEETVEGKNKMIYYTKIHAPWDVMCFYAEDLLLRAPLQAQPGGIPNFTESVLSFIKMPNIMAQDVPNTPLDYYTCPFKKSKLDKFIGSDDQATFFPSRERHRVVFEILATTVYGKRKQAQIGIERMLEEEIFAAAFPLHDGPWEIGKGIKPGPHLNPRQLLYHYWARYGAWYKYQPLDHIRDYFGEKIGIYFAWLGFYTAWLLPASVMGLLVFLYGVLTMGFDTPSSEVCNSGDTFKMCPLCDEEIGCAYWYLSNVCLFVRISYLFDNAGTVVFAIFMSFWAVTFLEYWKRKNASLAHHWDCSEYEEEEERPRPEYAALAPGEERNPITGIKEPYFPEKQRTQRIMSSIAVIIIMMILVIIFIIAVIVYRVLISVPLFRNHDIRSYASTVSSMSAAVVNLILIMALGRVYEKLAYKLTQWEMHRTQTEFEDQLIFKVYIFQFVNFYSSIIYIGFFKGRFVGYPGDYTTFFGLRNEECQNGGCMIELAIQLGVIMVGKQMINNAQEVMVPKLKGWLHRFKMGDIMKHKNKDRWEEDFQLIENDGLFEEYLEMVLQFGFITLFVAAFPLAPLFALLNNWLEIRLDAQKLVCETRRPVGERAQDIGVWFNILDGVAQLAVVSNAFLIAFTSTFLPHITYQYVISDDQSLKNFVNYSLAVSPEGTTNQTCRYTDFRDAEGKRTQFFWTLLVARLTFVIVFEHVVFGICRLIDILVPDIPESLEIKMKRVRYLAKQALADTDTIMKIASGNDDT